MPVRGVQEEEVVVVVEERAAQKSVTRFSSANITGGKRKQSGIESKKGKDSTVPTQADNGSRQGKRKASRFLGTSFVIALGEDTLVEKFPSFNFLKS